MPASQSTTDMAAASLVCGELTLDGTVQQLVKPTLGCKRVKLIAPNDAGVAGNTHPVYFGNSDRQDDWIDPDGSRDTMLHIDNVARVYVKGTAGEKIRYRAEV